MKNANEKLYEKRVQEMLPIVVNIASKYASNTNLREDLIQEGMIGVIKAVDNYDENKDNKFSTYAVYWIKKYILKYIGKSSNQEFAELDVNRHQGEATKPIINKEKSMRLPDNFPEKEREVIVAYYVKEMTIPQISEKMGISREQVRQVRAKALRRLRALGYNLDKKN